MEKIIEVILVDPQDKPIGRMEKMQAHLEGELHRAFSVIIYNNNGEMLLQRRADCKYHSPGKWSNACCGHPKPDENINEAATKRLVDELGLKLMLNPAFVFTYKTGVGDNLIEHEIDHVFTATSQVNPILNPLEASAFKWVNLLELKQDIALNSWRYTSWFIILLEKIEEQRN